MKGPLLDIKSIYQIICPDIALLKIWLSYDQKLSSRKKIIIHRYNIWHYHQDEYKSDLNNYRDINKNSEHVEFL